MPAVGTAALLDSPESPLLEVDKVKLPFVQASSLKGAEGQVRKRYCQVAATQCTTRDGVKALLFNKTEAYGFTNT